MTTTTIVVTRHPALVALLIERGLITADAPVIAHATAADVRDKHVIGVLPLSLASLALSVTEIPLNVPAELLGVELTLEQCREFAGETRTYAIRDITVPRKIEAAYDRWERSDAGKGKPWGRSEDGLRETLEAAGITIDALRAYIAPAPTHDGAFRLGEVCKKWARSLPQLPVPDRRGPREGPDGEYEERGFYTPHHPPVRTY